MNKLKYFFGKNTNKELKQISLLLTQVFNKDFDLDYLIWLYRNNPDGNAITFNISINCLTPAIFSVNPDLIIFFLSSTTSPNLIDNVLSVLVILF